MVYDYLSIVQNLPKKVWELAKPPEERSEMVTEMIKRFSVDGKVEPIQIQKLSMIVTNLFMESMEKLYELYDEIMSGVSKISRTVRLDRETADALDDACLDRQTRYRDLMSRIIRDWLRIEGSIDNQLLLIILVEIKVFTT